LWRTEAPDFPAADGWSLKTNVKALGVVVEVLTGVLVPGTQSTYEFTLTSEQTAAMPPGQVNWQIQAFMSPVVTTLATGSSLSCPNLTLVPVDFDPLSYAQRIYQALLVIGPSLMATGYASMEVDGMRTEFRVWTSMAELAWRDQVPSGLFATRFLAGGNRNPVRFPV
jgi:hypothetical protein